jgi:hypothetical protein
LDLARVYDEAWHKDRNKPVAIRNRLNRAARAPEFDRVIVPRHGNRIVTDRPQVLARLYLRCVRMTVSHRRSANLSHGVRG